jgi:2-deoxy-D-gluconate 3-dehydrogenase
VSAGGYLESLFSLAGRVALVTGARQGLGESIAIALARAGAHVAVTSRAVEGLAPLCERIRELHVEALPLELELTRPEEIDRAVEGVVERLGAIDVLVNNAALSIPGDAVSYAVDDWDSVLETNLRGTFLTSRAVARGMIERREGRIINLSSPFARVGLPDRAAYSASKAAVEQLTRSLAVEWAPSNVTVNAVAPTTVLTETRAERFRNEHVLRDRVAQIPLGRLGRTDDVAGAVLLLAGPAGGFITGQTLLVDGGYTVARA